MSKTSPSFQILVGVLLALTLLIFACQEPEEGCLDVEATNYDVSADDPCPECCTYPEMKLEIAHRYQDSLLFSFDSTYHFPESSPIATRFDQVIFYLSNFRLLNLSNDSLKISETIELDLLNGGVETFTDDYVLMSRSIPSFAYNVGEIRGSGSFNILKFSVGIGGNAAFSDATTRDDGHPLALTADTLWTDPEGYVFNKIIVIPDTSVMMPLARTIKLDSLVEVTLGFPQEVTLGFDISIPLKIDYKKWFSGIDFVGYSNEEIVDQIVNNTANAFSINE